MVNWLADRLQRLFRIPEARTQRALQLAGAALAAATFILTTTILVAFDSVFLGANNIAGLRVGDIAPQDIRAPVALPSYVSQVLTEQQRQRVRASVAEVYYLPDPGVSRRQIELARQILNYITNIRRDPFGTLDEKLHDLSHITDLTLSTDIARQILTMDEPTWNDVNEQVTSILERVMQGEIRESNLPSIRAQLPTQVSVRFSDSVARIIVAIVEDLVRPNTLLDPEATERARDEAAAQVEVRRSFERGQIVVRAGERIDEATYEALTMLGLLEPADRRLFVVFRALLASVLVMVVFGLYVSRFTPWLLESPRLLGLMAIIFLIVLFGARMTGLYGQLYLYPSAALALMFVAIVGPELALMGTLGLAMLVGLMQNNSLEIALLTAVGGLMAVLTLWRAERLNSFFMPGLLVSLSNVVVITIFFQGGTILNGDATFGEMLIYSVLNGILAATAALAGLYLITLIYNLPTGLKLVELSQPSQPLLQRLLREAPGTYQHSLQVANLAEQAANAIGANADLVRVAALYHDIGKMINAPFFTENQVEGMNPHDVLNDPARSADIIISHVTDGEKLARQYRLPARFRDFILEHHGTQVLYFYQQAVERAGDDEVVDIEQFTYPGPKPQSRETAILMIADSCEAAVRSRKPVKKQEIADTVQQIIDIKLRTGQLDESGLTLNDIATIRRIITDMLQAVFHPRISYPIPAREQDDDRTRPHAQTPRVEMNRVVVDERRAEAPTPPTVNVEPTRPKLQTREVPPVTVAVAEDDDSPLPEVPPLPRTTEQRQVHPNDNGQRPTEEEITEDHPD
ncbi:MAG: HDIG domain-containing protein [Chloroflexi bacterium]|nr:HDIG domain-containing protein [Chloroflexota bacterium]